MSRYEDRSLKELQEVAKKKNVKYSKLNKADLIKELRKKQAGGNASQDPRLWDHDFVNGGPRNNENHANDLWNHNFVNGGPQHNENLWDHNFVRGGPR